MSTPDNPTGIKELIKTLTSPEYRARKEERRAEQEVHEKRMAGIRVAMQSREWEPLRDEIEGKIDAIKETLTEPELSEKWRDRFVGCIMAYRYVLWLNEDKEANSVKANQEKTNAT